MKLAFLDPNLLWLAPPLLLLLGLASSRLAGLAPWRRRVALFLQSLAVIGLVAGLARPVLVTPDAGLRVVLVLDTSRSISAEGQSTLQKFAESVVAQQGPSTDVQVVTTGSRTAVLSPEQFKDIGKALATAKDAGSATDLASGLRVAGGLLGDTGRRRVVLVTDGWETQGNAAQEAGALRTRGIDLRVMPLTALGSAEVIARNLETTAYARVGDTVWSDLDIFSTVETSATLHISVDGAEAGTRRVTLAKGESRVPLEQVAGTEGFHRVEVRVESLVDTNTENNSALSTLVVKPKPQVLILQDRDGESSTLADALGRNDISVDIRAAETVPSQPGELDTYSAIVLDNVAATSLTLDQQRTLQEYVRRYGHGLVATGGQTSFAKGAYPDSVLEDMLPVLSHPAPRPEKGATALILVMDRSASMDDHIDMEGKFTKFSMAIDAARLAVDALRVGDTIGVLSFDTRNFWSVPVQTITSDADKDTIKNLIQNIEIGNGTSIFPAVSEAAQAIQSVSAPTRHLVLLTDGLDNGTERYEPILSGLQSAGISLSTIGIGSDADKDLLTLLAKLGQGRYYFTEQPQNIPKIMFRELDLALKEAVVEGSVQPHVLADSPLLRGVAPQDIPALGGYDITTAKDDSTLALVSDKGDPLLAHWNYGLGRVVAFMSEVGSGWGAKWESWQQFSGFMSGAVRWSMQSPVNHLLQPSVTVDAPGMQGGTAHLLVESLNSGNTFADLANIGASVRSPSGVVTGTTLVQTAPGRYEGEIEIGEAGAYQAIFTREGDTPVTEATGFLLPPGEELLHAGTNDALLQKLAGGGSYLKDAAGALELTDSSAAVHQQPLWDQAVAPALLLLLLSVAIRRVDFRLRGQSSA